MTEKTLRNALSILLATVLVGIGVLMATVPAGAVTGDGNSKAEKVALRVFTLKELAAFDGTNGKPAYIAVDGKVYDVTGSKAWRAGRHNGMRAGKDHTKAIRAISPHGVSVLKGLPIVGTLAPQTEDK